MLNYMPVVRRKIRIAVPSSLVRQGGQIRGISIVTMVADL